MIPVTLLLDQLDHMESADAAVWSAALASPAASSDPLLRRYLLHASGVQRAFLDAWLGRPFAFRDQFDDTTLAAEFAAVRAYYPEARAFIATCDADVLAGDMRLPWVAWIEEHLKQQLANTTLVETILQVFSHTTHHRGQAVARLRALDIEPPVVDYIAWVWKGRPAAQWPAAGARAEVSPD